MPEPLPLANEDKARGVLCRMGHPGNQVALFEPEEITELASIYDAYIATETTERGLNQAFDAFWAARQERLAAAKAADDTTEAPRRLFRNSRAAAAAPAASTPPAEQTPPDPQS
ncbi:MAG: hypothetical protein AB7G28_22785 [Pirellulales bacterium]